jgi:hypothetical protein
MNVDEGIVIMNNTGNQPVIFCLVQRINMVVGMFQTGHPGNDGSSADIYAIWIAECKTMG